MILITWIKIVYTLSLHNFFLFSISHNLHYKAIYCSRIQNPIYLSSNYINMYKCSARESQDYEHLPTLEWSSNFFFSIQITHLIVSILILTTKRYCILRIKHLNFLKLYYYYFFLRLLKWDHFYKNQYVFLSPRCLCALHTSHTTWLHL